MSVVLESANRINALKSAVEAVTGQSYDNLTQGIQALKDGYNTSKVEGVQYTDIIYNDDNTVTLIDTKGNEHTISCTYENNRLWSMTYDGKEVVTVYDNGNLVSVGETEVDVSNAPLDNTLENIIDQSGVLDSTEGTATEKVEQLLDKAEFEAFFLQLRFFKLEGNKDIVKTPLLDCINLTSLESAFLNCGSLKEIYVKNTQNVANWNNTFASKFIETIETLDFSSATNIPAGIFGADYIANIKIVPSTIKVNIRFGTRSLTSESIQSIIDGLATVETAQTLTLHADVKAKLTQTQLATITSKNWNLA